MKISDEIAKMIEEMLDESGGEFEFRRNDFATKMGCVPSQINYVITSRFTPEKGYVIESRRGGGGYIRIVKKQLQKNEYLMHFFCAIGDSLDEAEAAAYIKSLLGNNIINEREYVIMRAATKDASLMPLDARTRNTVRANILRHVILSLIA